MATAEVGNTRFAGRSETSTFKMELFRSLFEIELNMTKRLRQQPGAEPVFFYIDLNAGCGRYEDGLLGSPLLFLNEATRLNQPHYAFFCEAGAVQIGQLESALVGYDQRRFEVLTGDHRRYVNHIGASIREMCDGRIPYGLILIDPNDTHVPVWVTNEILHYAGRNKIDVAVHATANAWKRARRPEDERLPALLSQIKKKHRTYWDVYGKWEWVFSIHTDWEAFPARFQSLASPEVQAALHDRCALTKSERAAGGKAEIALPKAVTGRMRNISEHPSFGASGRLCLNGQEDGANAASPALQLRFTT